MDTAVPAGLPSTPKEERPRLINSTCTRAAQRWKWDKNNEKGTLDSSKSGDSDQEEQGLRNPTRVPFSKMRNCLWSSKLPVEEKRKQKTVCVFLKSAYKI